MHAICGSSSSFRAATAEDVMSEPRQAASRELLVAFRLFVLHYANVVPASLPALQTEANIRLY